MPDELIKTAQGEVLKQDEGAQIIEINDCSNDDINQNSKRLIQKTKQEYNNLYERQLFQKHCLTLIEYDKFFLVLCNNFPFFYKNQLHCQYHFF